MAASRKLCKVDDMLAPPPLPPTKSPGYGPNMYDGPKVETVAFVPAALRKQFGPQVLKDAVQ